ncbi:MAG: YihY/virulence factor BrkB family protein [Bacteroidales bacterium]|nr:YihY/virulence factor BrkB family protein [Bacteroidales bacterium]
MKNLKAYVRLALVKLRGFRRKVLYWRPVRSTLYFLQHFSLAGSQGVPLYDVLRFFLRSIFNGDINQRAKGLAYSFMTALPPLLIFFFTLVAYFPVDGIQDELLGELGTIVPAKVMGPLSNTVNDVMGHRHSTLLSIGFVSSVILAANGLMGVISSLNFANRSVEKRPYVQRYLLSIMLVFLIYVLLVLTIALMMGHKLLLQLIYAQGWLTFSKANTLMFNLGRWLLIIAAILTVVSLIYYWAPVKKQRVGFFSAGSVLATAMFLVLSWALGIYLGNFSRYNLLYGSIGTLLMVMFWIYFNCIVLLVGYELNISIYNGTIIKKNHDSRREFKQRIQNLHNDNTERTRESGDGDPVTA